MQRPCRIFISDSTVIAWATNAGVLDGAYLTQVMNFMQSDGLSEGGYVYDDGPYFAVDWTSAANLQSAISIGPVKIGVAADRSKLPGTRQAAAQAGSLQGSTPTLTKITAFLSAATVRCRGWPGSSV